jgi:hypothetical protein
MFRAKKHWRGAEKRMFSEKKRMFREKKTVAVLKNFLYNCAGCVRSSAGLWCKWVATPAPSVIPPAAAGLA